MNEYTPAGEMPATCDTAFSFHGSWREYLPIAITNLVLTLVTLGFYRFWATTRERKYLWGRTQFIDERLEWAGTGKEMFIGFLVAMIFFLPLILFFQFGLQALVLRGEILAAGIGFAASYLALLYLIGVARFRALRYRLSRTYWRGIRGGSDDAGWRFGLTYLWKSVVGFITLGLMVPWAMVTLWRERWGRMSFGSHAIGVGSGTATDGLMARWLLIYASPFAVMLLVFAFTALVAMAGIAVPDINAGEAAGPMFLAGLIGILLAYLIIPLMALAYYAAFYRKVVDELTLANIEFAFTASGKDWLKLILGHIGLAVVTLGFGLMFIGYRNWSFFVRHMEATGEINVAALTQSTTRLRSDAEGLADAFDIGAI